jgi:hypothetical protein
MTMKLAVLTGAILAMVAGFLVRSRLLRRRAAARDELAVRTGMTNGRGDVDSEDRGGVWADDGGPVPTAATGTR